MVFSSFLILSTLALHSFAAFTWNWEGSHIDVSPEQRGIDWWYTQVIGQTPAPNGIPPSIEVVFKHGNTFQYRPTNSPLYSVDVHGFDNEGNPFGIRAHFNHSLVSPNSKGETVGSWKDETSSMEFVASSDHRTFVITLRTERISGEVIIKSSGMIRTGCGGHDPNDSPFFDSLVADGRSLSEAESIMYQQTGWRITALGGHAKVNVDIDGKKLAFRGPAYKDSNWNPHYAMNDFIRSWYVMIAQVGPYSFVTFSGQAKEGKNLLNGAHLLKHGKFISSQCNIIGERSTDISVITPQGERYDSGVTVPTAFDIKFVLSDGKEVAFHATNQVENPSVSIYHRWVAKYTGGAEGEFYEAFGITEWMNPANISHWEFIE